MNGRLDQEYIESLEQRYGLTSPEAIDALFDTYKKVKEKCSNENFFRILRLTIIEHFKTQNEDEIKELIRLLSHLINKNRINKKPEIAKTLEFPISIAINTPEDDLVAFRGSLSIDDITSKLWYFESSIILSLKKILIDWKIQANQENINTLIFDIKNINPKLTHFEDQDEFYKRFWEILNYHYFDRNNDSKKYNYKTKSSFINAIKTLIKEYDIINKEWYIEYDKLSIILLQIIEYFKKIYESIWTQASLF